MKSLVLKPMTLNLDLPDLIAVLTFSRNVILLSIWNFLVSTKQVICHMGPLHSTPQEIEAIGLMRHVLSHKGK